ncbi:unnamed protein product [Urochloa decumbens]|uniref:Protein kinase domain-containing protein n=1 Tax=Urochloa decumbens TaxID=240449 RepID=A0ABC9C1Z0_9POAL
MHSLLVAAALLLLLLATTTAAAAAANIALPGCESKCGDVDIPYPFGTTAGCYRPGFKVTCQRSGGKDDDHAHPPKLLLGSDSVSGDGPHQVLEISVQNATVRVSSTVWFFNVGDERPTRLAAGAAAGGPLVLSAARNRLVHIGCGFRAASWGTTSPPSPQDGGGALAPPRRAHSTCSSSCSAEHLERQRTSRRRCDGLGWCDGIGCCDTPVPAASFGVRLEWNNGTGGGGGGSSPWIASVASVVAVEQEWWSRKDNLFTLKMSLLALGRASGIVVPALLDWALDNSSATCAEAAARPGFGCASKHSECANTTGSAVGYVCRCRRGYQGNPYVKDGCRSPRSFHPPAWIIFAMGLGIGIFLLLLVLATIFATKSLKRHKARKMKEHFFKQNRGLLLQQLVDKDIAERMIFSLEELEKATNKFDKARILGGGGHGMVYKGIISDQHVVAIKRSKLVIQREIDGFINEVAILSQINHRNVVKLFGCCLETEVPLLVYEFIPNGTLYAHLHVDGPLSLPWQDRLRIAFEVASSLAYLHSAASTSIVHRDIKTSNILLDDRLVAKVSDFGASRGISIDKSGLITAIQGTYGYLDPEYYYTRRLTEKSDVYSFGVVLVELLTRKKPTIDMSPDGISLVAHFIHLLSEDRLGEILDVQVIEEGGNEATQVAAMAAMCLQMKGDDRPTMRHIEMALQGLQYPSISFLRSNAREQERATEQTDMRFQRTNTSAIHDSCSRRYSMEREILSSGTFPR